MLASPWVFESFCESEVYSVDYVCLLSNANQKIVRLDVSVNEVFAVHELDAIKQLESDHDDGFQRELVVAELKEDLERRAEDLDDHAVVIVLDTKPVQFRVSCTSLKYFVELRLVFELLVFVSEQF